jgi:selenoprotein W-related protein
VRAASDLLHDYQHVIAEVRLITGSKGTFEVTVDGRTLYSKRERGRHANPGEVLQLFRDEIVPDVSIYPRD